MKYKIFKGDSNKKQPQPTTEGQGAAIAVPQRATVTTAPRFTLNNDTVTTMEDIAQTLRQTPQRQPYIYTPPGPLQAHLDATEPWPDLPPLQLPQQLNHIERQEINHIQQLYYLPDEIAEQPTEAVDEPF